jgi:hypothetical protein
MNKQRIITLVAVLCLAQLAVIASRQLQDKNSDLQRLRAHVESFTTSITKLFLVGGDSSTQSQSTRNSQGTAPSLTRPSELAPTFLKDDAPSAQPAPKPVSVFAAKPSEIDSEKNSAPRDPFVPFFAIRSNGQADATHPLTNYSIEQLRVTAIIGDSSGNRSASIEAHDGKSFIVRVGARVGDSGGRVERITPTTIVVVEPSDSAIGTDGAVTKELSLKAYPTPPSGLAN